MVILSLTIIVLMRIIQSIFNKKASLNIPRGVKFYMKYIGVLNLFAALFSMILVITERSFAGVNLQMIVIASCSGLALAVSSLCNIKALCSGTIALNSMFATAGLIVPCIVGIFMFDEPIYPIHIVCVVLLFISMAMLANSSKKTSKRFSKKTILYLVGSLLSEGAVMLCQKVFGKFQPSGNVSLFSMLTFLIPAVVILCAIPFVSERSGMQKKFPRKLVGYAVILAFAVFVIQQLVTLLTPLLPSSVLFTFSGGSATIVAALVGAVVYNEKITVKSACGIILGVVAIMGLNIFY